MALSMKNLAVLGGVILAFIVWWPLGVALLLVGLWLLGHQREKSAEVVSRIRREYRSLTSPEEKAEYRSMIFLQTTLEMEPETRQKVYSVIDRTNDPELLEIFSERLKAAPVTTKPVKSLNGINHRISISRAVAAVLGDASTIKETYRALGSPVEKKAYRKSLKQDFMKQSGGFTFVQAANKDEALYDRFDNDRELAKICSVKFDD